MNSTTLADFLNTNRFDADTISRARADLVETETGGLSTGAVYDDLVQHAGDAEALGQMLNQLSDDYAFAEQVNLITRSATRNSAEAVSTIQVLLHGAAKQSQTVEADRHATIVLYGVHVLACDRSMAL